jgi:DNA invertase Pin-like site-specific DNA recombinase
VLARRAVVYIRQSTEAQVHDNLESQRQQYALVDHARSLGFRDVVAIDEDLGRSASGLVDRPGFQSLVARLCEGTVGAIFALEASRLARNGRDWHHLIELCGLVGARLIDSEGVYDPSQPNDRLLLGLKGTMSEFELTVIRRRLAEAALAKARRGELRICVPIGYVWSKETGLCIDPDQRVQAAVHGVFRAFARLGSARQVQLHLRKEGLLFPCPKDPKRPGVASWRVPSYGTLIALFRNPFFAGAYAYGKSAQRTRIIDGKARKSYGHLRPMKEWVVLLQEHHPGYISWEVFERNQECLARNAFRKRAGESKSGRGGRALLAGLLRCLRCGRMLKVAYGGGVGRRPGVPRYRCNAGHLSHGLDPCISFGALRPDEQVARQILVAVQPLAVEAAAVAEQRVHDHQEERLQALLLEQQQAEYEVRLAARRYESVDPDNRLVAATLEARWNAALERLRDCEERIAAVQTVPANVTNVEELRSLALNLEAAWKAPSTPMRVKQQLVRLLLREIIVDLDDRTDEVILVLHWQGGAHTELRTQKPRSGEHTKRTGAEALRVLREMATQESDEHIAATLNRMGLVTGYGNAWTARRVSSCRRKAGIRGYESAIKDGRCLTLYEAAQQLGVSSHVIRKLITAGLLPAHQVVADAPWQIQNTDLQLPAVQEALRNRQTCPKRRRRVSSQQQVLLAMTETERSGAE